MKKKQLLKLFISKGLVSVMTAGIFLASNSTIALAENVKIDWQKCFGGSNSGEMANSVQQTDDGGYIIVGDSYSPSGDGDVIENKGKGDYWLVKLKENGDIDWQKSLGGSGDDYANSVQQTSDGGYIIAGSSLSDDKDVSGNKGDYDYWIVKLDSSGDIDWQKNIGGTGWDTATQVQQTIDGGYIISGTTYSTDIADSINNGDHDSYIVKLDSNGEIDWKKCLGGSGSDSANSVQQTTDGGYIISGATYSTDITGSVNNGGRDYYIVKLDSNGR